MPGVIHTPPRNRDRKGVRWRNGTAWKFVLHTTDSGYRPNSGGADNYHGHQSCPHFEINEDSIEQYLPLTVGPYVLTGETPEWGTGRTRDSGRDCVERRQRSERVSGDPAEYRRSPNVHPTADRPETLLADVHGRHGHGMASAYNLADRGTPGTADRAARRGLGTQPRTLGQLGRRVLAG